MESVVAIDQGSSSSRALRLDAQGRVLKRAQVPLRIRHPAPGHVDHDPEELWSTQNRALERVLSGHRLPEAIAIAAQRSTVVFWDSSTGKAVGPALSWMDGRSAPIVERLRSLSPVVMARTGLVLTPYYSAPKIAWALENLPEVRGLADSGRLRIGPVATFLVHRLTRGEVFATDPTFAQRMLLLDIDRVDWDEELLRGFGIPREALPKLLPSRAQWGEVRRPGGRVPIRAVLGDQQAAALGLGVAREGQAALNYGTGAFLLLHTGSQRPRVPGILASVASQAADGRVDYLAEGTVHAAGTSFDWLHKNLGVLRGSTEVDRLWKASKRRVWCLPAIGGLGAPRWDYKTQTLFFGLDSQTRREDLVRAVGEGIAFLIADIAQAVRAGGHPIRAARASGGLSRIGSLVRFQADLLQAPVLVSSEPEVTALGAARMAGLDVPAGKRERRVEPGMGAAQAERLHKSWGAFVEGAQRLSQALSAS